MGRWEPPPQTPWYKENPFWGAISGVLSFGLTGLGFAMTGHPTIGRWLFWLAFPWALMGLWIAANGIIKNRKLLWTMFPTFVLILVILFYFGDRTMKYGRLLLASGEEQHFVIESDMPAPNGASVSLLCDHRITWGTVEDGTQYGSPDSLWDIGIHPKNPRQFYLWFHWRKPDFGPGNPIRIALIGEQHLTCTAQKPSYF